MSYCKFCKKTNISPSHYCRTMKSQARLEPFDSLLRQMLIVEKMPIYRMEQTSEEWAGIKISGAHLRDWCRINGITTMSIKESANLLSTREQYKSTVEQRYGVDNVSKSTSIKEKKVSTNQDRHGVDNPFQRAEIKDKITTTLLEKYGVSNARYLPRSTDKHMLTKPHQKLSNWLLDQGFVHENEIPNLFPKKRSKNNRIYSPIVDIWMQQYRIVIEIFGTYWHADPRVYYPSDIIQLHIGPTTAQEIWENDKLRQEHIESFNVTVITIWEIDIKKSFDKVKELIHNTVNLTNSY